MQILPILISCCNRFCKSFRRLSWASPWKCTKIMETVQRSGSTRRTPASLWCFRGKMFPSDTFLQRQTPSENWISLDDKMSGFWSCQMVKPLHEHGKIGVIFWLETILVDHLIELQLKSAQMLAASQIILFVLVFRGFLLQVYGYRQRIAWPCFFNSSIEEISRRVKKRKKKHFNMANLVKILFFCVNWFSGRLCKEFAEFGNAMFWCEDQGAMFWSLTKQSTRATKDKTWFILNSFNGL